MMNGLSLLVFLTLFGQIGPLGSTVADSSQAVDDGKNYGWQINKYNELEYLIQISPDMLGPMNDPVNKRELESQIPRELIGRIKRVVVSIGNETLPRTPLSEIEKLLPAATASLPPGRMQDLESGSVVNVNNNGGDGFPTYSPGQSFSDSTAKTPGTSPLGSAFMQQAAGTAPPTNTGTALDAYAKQREQSRFNSTATNDFGSTSSGVGGSNWQSSATAALPGRTGLPTNAFGQQPTATPSDPQSLQQPTWGGGAQPGFGTQPTAQAQGGYASNGGYGANGNTGYSPNTYDTNGYQGNAGNSYTGNSFTGTQSSTASRGGFGDSYGQFGNSLTQQGRGGALAGAATPASGGYLASADSNRVGLPSTSHDPAVSDRNYSQPLQQQQTQGLPNQRTLTAQQQAEQTLQLQRDAAVLAAAQSSLNSGSATAPQNYAAQESNYFFYVFFILSIAVNLWMVHLLRSLYLRYRNLLSSLRSQATSLS